MNVEKIIVERRLLQIDNPRFEQLKFMFRFPIHLLYIKRYEASSPNTPIQNSESCGLVTRMKNKCISFPY